MKGNKRLNYTLIAEGHAEYSFVPTYLRLIAQQHNIQVIRSKLGFKGSDAGKSKVLKDADKICTVALQLNHQLIVIGVDLDTTDYEQEQLKHTIQCNEVGAAAGKAYKQYRGRIIIYVPIQAIEHWMAYQAYKVGLIGQYAPNGIESRGQEELKRILYKGRENGPYMEDVAKAIAEKADFNELAKQSRSFAHFHEQIIAFLESYNTTPS